MVTLPSTSHRVVSEQQLYSCGDMAKENDPITSLMRCVEEIQPFSAYGFVKSVKGLLIECTGLSRSVSVGSQCEIVTRNDTHVVCEVVGFDGEITMVMPFTEAHGIGAGCKIWFVRNDLSVYPDISWMGRVINGFAEPVDDGGVLPTGAAPYALHNRPPPAHKRKRVQGKIDLGVRVINTFTSCCSGQRMGIFSGSGVGKSMLVSMLTKFSEAEVKVIGLIGERGREVQEFIKEYLGPEGLKKAVVIVATSDESALMRKQAAFLTMAVAEYFRDQGKEVLCLMDSVTRFAMAQREIGLSVGEPPTTRGYTPSVFVELPKLLERAGPGMEGQGSITGLFSVLVEGDDHNEPISDAVRGILDGHIVLDRKIAERGRFPAVNVLRSVSRTMPGCNTPEENALVTKARQVLATYDDMAEMIRLGAYRKGADAQVDEAIRLSEPMEGFLAQAPEEQATFESGYAQLATILQGAGKKAPELKPVGKK